MFNRVILSCLCLLIFTFTSSFAQIMHIHMGENERVFDLANVDSITYVDTVIDLSVEPAEIDFGEVAVGNVQEANLTISNIGNAELIINAFEIAEIAFEVVFVDPVSIRPDQSVDFNILFIPVDGGEIVSEMAIHSNSQENPEVIIPLSGTGMREFIWEYEQTDTNMSVLILSATINDESLVEGDLVGVFTPNGLCAGYSMVPDGFPENQIGLSVWGAEQGQNNGFRAGEQLSFRIWDASTFSELLTEFEVEDNGNRVWESEGFIQVRINAIVE